MTKYVYEVKGIATEAYDQTWHIRGTIDIPAGGFSEAIPIVLSETFSKLTHGKAVFGRPGLGCNGPYKITKLTVEIE